jgi:long-chain acyl-CoA synthetase
MTTYADRPWTKHYDAGVPASLKPYPEKTLFGLMQDSAAKFADRPALTMTTRLPLVGHQQRTLTYAELDHESDALAAGLLAMGLNKGDRVAILMPNMTAFVIAYYGILKAGGVVVATNPTYPAEKLRYQIDDSDAQIVIAMSLYYDTLKQIQPETQIKHIIVSSIKEYLHPVAAFMFRLTMEKKDGHYIETLAAGDRWLPDLLAAHAGQKPNITVEPDDTALIQYTGGTTGISKGAVSTHRALVASTCQVDVWTSVDLPGVTMRPRHDLLVLAALPMFHVYGLVVVLSLAMASGMHVVLVPNPRDVDGLVDMLDVFQPDIFLGVPTLYSMILNHERVKSGDVRLDSIIISQSGASPMEPALKQSFEAAGGRRLFEGYGMSEIPCGNHSNPLVGENKPYSVGMPLPDVECEIVSLEDGESVMPVGDIGEIVIHAPHMMQGYHKMPTETANTLRTRADGRMWVFTGDIGYMDADGYFFIVDRKKDMALIGGFNVYPANVEKVLLEHPAVAEVGVVAVPHPEKAGQEALKAWIVLKHGQTVTPEALIAFCEPHLAGYEIPRRYAFVESLPKSAVGKILRRELAQLEMEG